MAVRACIAVAPIRINSTTVNASIIVSCVLCAFIFFCLRRHYTAFRLRLRLVDKNSVFSRFVALYAPYTIVIQARHREIPAVETARCIYAPAYPPAVAHRREISCKINENNHTRIPRILAGTVTVPCPRRLIAYKQEGDGFVEKPSLNEKPRGRHGLVKVVLTWV